MKNETTEYTNVDDDVFKVALIEPEIEPMIEKNQNFIENSLIILTKHTLDVFLSQKNPAELIGLYTFYYYTAKWQESNQIKCTTSYVAKGLHWHERKVMKVKKQLVDMGLIQNVQRKDRMNKIKGWYIKINYVFKNETVKQKSHTVQIPHCGFHHSVENIHPNALSANNINALSANSLSISKDIHKEIPKEGFPEPVINRNKDTKNKRKQYTLPNKDKYYISVIENIFNFIKEPSRLKRNNKPIFRTHDMPTIEKPEINKTVKELIELLKEIENKSILDKKLKDTFIKYKENLKQYDLLTIKDLQTALKVSLNNFLTYFESHNFPENKDILPKTLGEFIYNEHAQSSWFLKCLEEKSTELSLTIANRQIEQVDDTFTKIYIDIYRTISPQVLKLKEALIKKNIAILFTWYQDWLSNFAEDNINKIGDQYSQVTPSFSFARFHTQFLLDRFIDGIEPGHIQVGGYAFEMFLKYCKDADIDFSTEGIANCKLKLEVDYRDDLGRVKQAVWNEYYKDKEYIREECPENYVELTDAEVKEEFIRRWEKHKLTEFKNLKIAHRNEKAIKELMLLDSSKVIGELK